MGHERWFRGQHDGQGRPFDWLSAARQHGIPDKLARVLYEQATQQAHGTNHVRVQEIYLALLAGTRRDAARPSPGKVTRTVRLQAHQAGKRRRPYISQLTDQPIAPGRRTLTSYIESAAHEVRTPKIEQERQETNAPSDRAVSTAVPADLQNAVAPTRSLDDQVQPGKARTIPSRVTRPSIQDIMVPGTVAYRQFQANLSAAFGHFDELEALEKEGISSDPMTVMEASPTGADGVDFVDPEVNEWPLSSESQFTREWQVRGRLTGAWAVQLDDSWPETSPKHVRSPVWGEPYQVQLADKEEDLLPLMAIPGRQVENWRAAGPIQAAGLQGIPEVPVRLPGHGGGTEMPEEVRAKMDAAFGMDFSAVRIHEGRHVEAIGALAYTQGTDIHFAPGQYQPTSPCGQEILGHELTHVVQQWQGRVRATTQASGVNINDDASLEREADEMGASAARGAAGRVPLPGLLADSTEYEVRTKTDQWPRAHELTHAAEKRILRPDIANVGQSAVTPLRGPGEAPLQRQVDRGTPEPCDSAHTAEIAAALITAREWRSGALQWFEAQYLTQIRAAARLVANREGRHVEIQTGLYENLQLLETHFRISTEVSRLGGVFPRWSRHEADGQDLDSYANVIELIRDYFRRVDLNDPGFDCSSTCPRGDSGSEVLGRALLGSGRFTIYTGCFDERRDKTIDERSDSTLAMLLAGTVLHECFHASFPEFRGDSYSHDEREYPGRRPYTNADSYATFASIVATGTSYRSILERRSV